MNVWEATVDDGTWQVQVVRTGEYTGTLEIYRRETDEKIHSEDVGLSYGSIFGPDAADVNQWADRAIEVIDAQ